MPESVLKQFNYFKVHTQYSICEGTVKIEDLKNYCRDNKIKSVGISDTNNLCGALEFSEEISKSGTQPIIGTQINIKLDNELGLLPIIAKNLIGYKSLVDLSSKRMFPGMLLCVWDPSNMILFVIAHRQAPILCPDSAFGVLMPNARNRWFSSHFRSIGNEVGGFHRPQF